MKEKEKIPYTSPILEMIELRNEQGFATSGETSSFGTDEYGSWD